MVNLVRICEGIARITSDNVDPGGVNRQSTWKGSANTLQALPLRVLILGPHTHTGLSVLCGLTYITINNSILHFLPR